MTDLPIGPDWISTTAAAAQLGVTQKTVWRFIEDGELPATRKGVRWKVRLTDVRAFLEQHRVQPGDLSHLIPPRVSS